MQLLCAWADGDREALEELTPRVYGELRRIAGFHMRNEQRGAVSKPPPWSTRPT
jgi:hypothetical protein